MVIALGHAGQDIVIGGDQIGPVRGAVDLLDAHLAGTDLHQGCLSAALGQQHVGVRGRDAGPKRVEGICHVPAGLQNAALHHPEVQPRLFVPFVGKPRRHAARHGEAQAVLIQALHPPEEQEREAQVAGFALDLGGAQAQVLFLRLPLVAAAHQQVTVTGQGRQHDHVRAVGLHQVAPVVEHDPLDRQPQAIGESLDFVVDAGTGCFVFVLKPLEGGESVLARIHRP